MVRLEKVTEKTFFPVVRMKVSPEQEKFVAANVMSLAQAWLYYDFAKPFAILDDDTVVGFMMLDWNEEERLVGIWRMMIGQEHQRKGYGRSALEEVLKMVREAGEFDMVHLSYVENNAAARELYYSLGFRETGEKDDDEIIMTLPLTDRPKVGTSIAGEDDLDDILEMLKKEKAHGAKIHSTLDTEESLKKAVENEQVRRLTLMGETIGLYFDGELLMAREYMEYLDEAKERIKRIA
jgi:diamine N-acetyltransferase